ncbi:glucokinase /transcriptional regulator [Natranaerovirga pectinivora]|uniref:Glucokinase /transcriptional regulator n=1 Tax=Natranaerovirga pectinivora TaxID=682400 RepID=A0A4V2V0C6_9FIRM|nr:ROK family protein [Natranaerovirga pectinivora]TCT15370.1 glucokinase /transcriptional regulator [Natranaerovirga pectinivora]
MYTIGIDLGGTNIAIAITKEGKILIKKSIPTFNKRDYKDIVKDMGDTSLALINEVGLSKDEIQSVGIGSTGLCDSNSGTIIYSSNLNFNNAPIREAFQKYLNVPVYIENDANVAAFGEYHYGAGKKYKDLVAITLGTGVGGGIILDGRLITGSFNGGGEIGHMVIEAKGEQCSCGRKGCWEAYSSATALIRDTKKAALQFPHSMINKLVENDLNKINGKTPFDAAELGDEIGKKVIKQYIEYLSIGMANIINIFQPEVIVISGGISNQRDKLIEPLKERISKKIYGGIKYFKTDIRVAELGDEAGVLGASILNIMHNS